MVILHWHTSSRSCDTYRGQHDTNKCRDANTSAHVTAPSILFNGSGDFLGLSEAGEGAPHQVSMRPSRLVPLLPAALLASDLPEP